MLSDMPLSSVNILSETKNTTHYGADGVLLRCVIFISISCGSERSSLDHCICRAMGVCVSMFVELTNFDFEISSAAYSLNL